MTQFNYFGHSCFSVVVGGRKILFDPFISHNPLAEGKVDVSKIEADYILISHGHVDHVDDAVRIAKQTKAPIVSNPEVVNWLVKNGLSDHEMHAANTGGNVHFEFGRVQCVNATHSSSMPDRSYGGNPMGFVVESPDVAFYYSGDTGLTTDMQLIPVASLKKRPALDFAVLCIGDNYTMGIDDAVRTADFIKCSTIVGCHYDTFPVIKIDHKQAIDTFERAGKKLLLPGIGESISIG